MPRCSAHLTSLLTPWYWRLPAGLAAYMSWVPTLQLLLGDMQPTASCHMTCSSSGEDGSSSRESAGGGSSTHGGGGRGGRARGTRDGLRVCCFTDFNEEAIHRGRQLIDYLLGSSGGSTGGTSRGSGSGRVAVEVGLNPFRKPAAVLAADNALPAASNGFALWLTRPSL